MRLLLLTTIFATASAFAVMNGGAAGISGGGATAAPGSDVLGQNQINKTNCTACAQTGADCDKKFIRECKARGLHDVGQGLIGQYQEDQGANLPDLRDDS